MATITGNVEAVGNHANGFGPSFKHTISSMKQETEGCLVSVSFPSGTYAQADDAQFAPATAIQDSRRDGKVITPLGAVFVSAGSENGSIVGAGACTLEGGLIKCPLLQADLSTERANGAMSATWERPITFFVTYLSPVNGEVSAS